MELTSCLSDRGGSLRSLPLCPESLAAGLGSYPDPDIFVAIDLTLDSPSPPDAVLASIARSAGAWRESEIPATLRQHRVIGVDGTVDGSTFRFSLVRRWYWRGEGSLHVRGTVRPRDGGSVVQIHCGIDSPIGLVDFLLGAFVLWVLLSDLRSGMFVTLVFGVAAIVTRASNSRISRLTHPEADYLVRRVETAVAVAAAASAPSLLSPAG